MDEQETQPELTEDNASAAKQMSKKEVQSALLMCLLGAGFTIGLISLTLTVGVGPVFDWIGGALGVVWRGLAFVLDPVIAVVHLITIPLLLVSGFVLLAGFCFLTKTDGYSTPYDDFAIAGVGLSFLTLILTGLSHIPGSGKIDWVYDSSSPASQVIQKMEVSDVEHFNTARSTTNLWSDEIVQVSRKMGDRYTIVDTDDHKLLSYLVNGSESSIRKKKGFTYYYENCIELEQAHLRGDGAANKIELSINGQVVGQDPSAGALCRKFRSNEVRVRILE